MLKNKRGIVDNLIGLISGIGAVGIVLAITFLVMAQTKSSIIDAEVSTLNYCANGFNYNRTGGMCQNATGPNTQNPSYSATYNSTVSTINSIQQVPAFLPIIIIVLIGITLMGVVKLFKRAV